ncbi:AraC family transcriptional regulator of adaptative response / DNA-3-methyladenine glycosylase II [Microbacteriaceae bacterium SG_E_30_P1]|uniref:DNA-3-methyladenine glycosylase II n=1 Tax=Antiquaquibacter oligotrophicus TaxID=2880260 RepID=A0ABT6KKW9_9MICO|nr:Ada metal-binding domain-containing protein [Antiquaquibacter oligotrophicus]MDH6180644.1 AraC family transcriptional regulator of adaptative response / DNA-3-methyladenine glycosylase II [Antiquaquibacter oligotrophicus]UDF13627.1 helix-turn-helix domain-containing protein [Antiquaquibacter oligotrophicus]
MTDQDARFDERYRALASRDPRFDGQFIAGVHSTGIYCRPSCPAMTPHRRNVRFYRTAAAAHEAGLRACKRCLPDAVPGSPDWNINDDLASRAMRLILDGVVDREGVPGLARRLGYTDRHLVRVLTTELGAGPLALARAHRAQSARALLVSTSLPMSDVAFASGFASIRQFNDTMLAVYRLTPTAIRRSATPKRVGSSVTAPAGAQTVTLRLPTRPPFNGPGLMTFLADHTVPGWETGDSDVFERNVRLPNGDAHVRFTLEGDTTVLCAATLDHLDDLPALIARVRRFLDLDADSAAIDGALSRDALLSPLVARVPGIRIPGVLDAEEALFRTLVGQQISVAAARTVLGTLTRELGESGRFPTAVAFAERGREVLRGPASRISTIVGAAEAILDGRLRLDIGMPAREFMEQLVALPGIGPWTAGYLAMRVLGNPDILLTSDLVVLQSARGLGIATTAKELEGRAHDWAPWRSYAGLHLWRARPTIGS